MKKLHPVILFVMVFHTCTVFAHGPARVKLQDQITIAAPPEKVWSLIADFCSVKDWNPLITDCSNDGGNEPGAVRTISLDNGAMVTQKLSKRLPEKMLLQYYMTEPNPDAYPVNSHGVTLQVNADENGGSVLQLKGNFYRLFQGQTPPAGQTDEDGKKALMRIHRAGMENIKKLAEQ